MEYKINPGVFGNVFTLPAAIADKHLKLASAAQLKVILYIFRHIADTPEKSVIAAELRLPENEVEDSILYWANCGILLSTAAEKENTVPKNTENVSAKRKIKPAKIMPSREEVGKRAAENPAFKELLAEAQIKFGRLLKTSESSALLWLLEDEGMDISLILMLIEYAVSENRCNISFIERTATEWLNSGITTITDAERHIKSLYRKKTAWKVLEKAFGIDDRLPSEKELEYSQLWINEWGFDEKILKLAYDRCVDAKSKFIMSYTAKILEGWHKSGYKTDKDVLNGETDSRNGKNNFATYDIDLVEEMLNKGYGEN